MLAGVGVDPSSGGGWKLVEGHEKEREEDERAGGREIELMQP